MFGMVSFKTFLKDLSSSPSKKAALTGLTVAGLCVPAAILLTFGHSERLVVTSLLVAIIPFQYLAYCLLQLPGGDQKLANREQTALSLRESSSKTLLSVHALFQQQLRSLTEFQDVQRVNELLQRQLQCLRELENLERQNRALQLQLRRFSGFEQTFNVQKNELCRGIPSMASIMGIIVGQVECSVQKDIVDLSKRNDEVLSQELKDLITAYPLSPNVGVMLNELTRKSSLDDVIRIQRAPFEIVD